VLKNRFRTPVPLPSFQASGPRRYARILDAAYVSLKRQSQRNLVIGGNTFTTGDVSPRQFIRSMRLPNGRPPRMDMYGHNPFLAGGRTSAKDLLGTASPTSPTSTRSRAGSIETWDGAETSPCGYFCPNSRRPVTIQNYEFNFYVTRKVQASWLGAALRITQEWKRIYALGWIALYDEKPNGRGDEVNRGLLEWDGDQKPSYRAYRQG
jgi:hypothetical protein